MIQNIPLNVQQGVARLLKLRGTEDLIDFSYSAGGCINPGGKLKAKSGTYFLKWNSAKQYPSMFEAEAKGLHLLRDTKVIEIPEVIGVGQDDTSQFLLLTFVEQGPPTKLYWKNLGSGLGHLHQSGSTMFGLAHDNYIGSLNQFNKPNFSWVDFFIHQRLEAQLNLAQASGLVDERMMKNFDSLYLKLPSLLPEEKPSLLHGDLWSGNIISDRVGDPCLIDPAVYYGSREMDLAMTRLFGSFPEDFYDAYTETFPLLPEYRNRIDLYNLYPLLVHLNLFGAEYRNQIVNILRRYI